ncbi:stage IV sporulation protein FB [Scopulibacillus darangshiensis]|uniref:Stage IV sporulation protein FB n=1 Tax=Scopulibacillus darangshiensis TaxID=442528 RepID=A0A4R2PAX1_9BACL|nr:M50 family metallopeptidase [Scopulibacillus darangshiensis]TCP32243.1 stage IV sporulation protein FB [Scopulibacillus darangshiensis]
MNKIPNMIQNTGRFSLLKIKIHPVFWFVVAAGLITGHFWEVASVFFIVFIHECGHAIAALLLGWRVREIQLLPFGGVAKVDDHGNRPMHEDLIVTLAGPVQHLWLPLLSYLFLLTDYWDQTNHQIFITYNFMILLFNSLPIWPLDGGKLMFLLLLKAFPFKRAYDITLILSCFILIILSIYVGVATPFTLNYFVVGSFICFSIIKEWKERRYVFMRFLLSRWRDPVPFHSTTPIVVTAKMPVATVLGLFKKGSLHPVIIEETRRHIEEKDILNAFFSGKCFDKPIGECFK